MTRGVSRPPGEGSPQSALEMTLKTNGIGCGRPMTVPQRFSLGSGAQTLLGAVLFCFFMLTGSREKPWADATPMYEVAEALVSRGELNIPTPWPSNLHPGRGGKTYAIAPLLQSLQHVPGVLVRKLLVTIWPGSYELSLPFAAHFGPAALGALAAVLLLSWCGFIGLGMRASLLATVVLCSGTMIWVYARSPYSEGLQAVCFTAFTLQVARASQQASRKSALWLGLTAALLINSKTVFALSVAGAAVWLVIVLWGQWPRVRSLVTWGSVTFIPVFALIPLYNWVRWGSPLHEGYDLSIPVFEEHLGLGLWGLFLSPGKSLFLYCPPLLVSIVALPRVWRRMRSFCVMALLVSGPVVLLYGKMLYWSGDYAWGPRYLTFVVPLLLLPSAVLLDDLLGSIHTVQERAQLWWARFRIAVFAMVCVLGVFVQILGSAFYWDHYIRITQDARDAWLGTPDRSGAPTPTVDGLCGACFEDVHQLQWLPAFVPIEGHYWLLRHSFANDDWTKATADAPWSRYTKKPLYIENTYNRVRLDWWPIEFWQTGRGGMGVVLCLWLVLGATTALWRLVPKLKAANKRELHRSATFFGPTA